MTCYDRLHARRLWLLVVPLSLWLISLAGGCGDGGPDDARSVDALHYGYPVQVETLADPEGKLDPSLRLVLSSRSRTQVRILVDLAVQLDLEEQAARLRASGASRLDRRRTILKALRSVGARAQQPLVTVIEELARRGEVSSHRSYPLLNRLLIEGTPEALRILARRPEIARIVEETAEPVFGLTSSNASFASLADSLWALEALGVREAWNRGLDGDGVLVGIIDAGASAAHEQLSGGYRGGPASWLDPTDRFERPNDSPIGHGTSVLSVAVGSAPGRPLGVAPRARWLACVGLPGGNLNNVAVTECAEWLLSVGQPDILINSWVVSSDGCDDSLRRIVDVWRAAEILPVFAAGNLGPDPGSDRSPGNYAGLYPGSAVALSVGAHTRGGEAMPHSSRGPGSCAATTYPSLVAPGAGVQAAFPFTPSTYIAAKGTSIAAGFVAGAAALLLQSRPESWVWEIEEALREGTVDVGDPGPDAVFGYGRLHVPSALAALEAAHTRRVTGSRPLVGGTPPGR